MSDLDALVRISRKYGGDPEFVLAGGGNTSVKTDSRLWVKGSGHALATIGAEGFVELDRDKLDAILRATWPADPKAREARFVEMIMAARVRPELGQRPSVEALLHHLLPQKFVVHTHASLINAFTCCASGEKLAREVFGEDFIWIPYVDPGLILARALAASLWGAPASDICTILLQNHGLVVAGESEEAIAAESTRLLTAARHRLGPDIMTDVRIRPADIMGPSLIMSGGHVGRMLKTPAALEAALNGPLTPDQIVYCRSTPVWLEKQPTDAELKSACEAYGAEHGFEPWVVLVKDVGMIVLRDSEKLARITADIFNDAARIYVNASTLGPIKILNDAQRRFIEDWEVESYRRSIAAK